MNSTSGRRDRGNYSMSTDNGMDTPSETSFGTPTASSRETTSFLDTSCSRRRFKPSDLRECAPQSEKCISCKHYSLIKTAIIGGFFTLIVLGLYITVILTELLKQGRSPIVHPTTHQPPRNPDQKPAPHSLNAPWPGSRYVITEADSLKAVTYVKDGIPSGSIQMGDYLEGHPAQIWAVSMVNGWMSFSPMSKHGPPFFMGCKPWPSHDNLYCREDFPDGKGEYELKRLPNGGYQVMLRNDVGWWPPSWFRPKLIPAKRNPSTDIWWRFTNIDASCKPGKPYTCDY
ncbi:hypothetical protein TWF730_004027 [Orbilia blumenaviensis]|uniref:Uncharacterized protein n=1 Tax=Orbilia blumenaviensis TaxID=1796055 RepID=A0AAV9U1U9_9PEZI